MDMSSVQKGQNFVFLTENNNWEITVSKNNDLETIIIGQPLFIWRKNGPDTTGR